MRRFILLAFVGTLLMKNVTSSIQSYPSNLAWLFGLNDKVNDSKKATNVCKNQECEKIAKVISESMDKSLDPCDDFYEYACGKWPEHNPIPKGIRSWSLFHMLQKNVEQQVNDILKEGPRNSDLLAVKLAKRWYAVCMNTDAMDKQGLDPLVTTISRIGGWPMIMDPDEWDEQEYSWQKVDDKYLRLTGNNVFHDVRVNIYSPNKTVKIDTPHLPPDSFKLWIANSYDSDEIEDEDDEDPSDEQDNQEIENEDDDDDNSDDNTNEQNKDKEAKKKISKRKSTGKFSHKKNKNIQHNRKTKSGTRILKKHDNHKTKKQRVKRQATPTKVHSKRAQHLTHRDKLRKSKRNHVRKAQDEERTKETLEMVSTSTTPQITEKTSEGDVDDETAQQIYANYISKVARAIAKARGTEVSEEHIDKDIEDMIKFQVKLTEIVLDAGWEDMELTLNEFQEWYDKKESKTTNSKINWVYKVAELFDEAHVSVDGDLNLEIGSSDYFEALVSLLDETSRRTIVNYIHWNYLSKMIETTTSEMRKLYYAWEDWQQWEEEDEEDEENEDEEDEEESERERRSFTCLGKAQLHDILAYEYVKRHFSDDITKTAEDMVDDIQKEVEYQIKKSDWLDEDTKDYVFAKLVNMKKFIGYPDWYRNNTIVKRYFQGLIIGNSYYENTLSYSRYSKWKQLRELKKDEDDDDIWWMSPLTVNAFFSPDANSIMLSAADFQSPFFAYGRPQAINYGIVGVIMAHEVNHGFDDDGILYDKNGDFVEWLSIMSQEYSKKASCFVEQFNNYPIEKNSNKKIENYGNQTSGENIADTMGLQASFRAYQRRERECGKPDTVLPGLEEVTNDQLFFLSFANVWCEATTDSNITERYARMDVHSTGRLRVIGSVSNSEDFAKAFSCPVGSAMNPERKCNIWK
ncbi:neprilysin-like isoform X2 [Formica exsecta]|uniref:neprilysin-like isoform X2 n=1 Tax=Formica exsecta TaxID=72781 RepID=UPI001142D4C7|nr:neprilysin-like isoform X2 [Formica exsecta]